MFERYTERARRVLVFARYEASQLGSISIETEHLLLGLIREGKGLTSRIFARSHLSLENIRKEIEGRTVFREKVSTSVEIPFSAETKRVLQFAAEEAKGMGLVDRVVPEAELDGYVRDYALTIAANAPMTMHAAKTSILESLKDPADRDLAHCEQLVDACNTSQDYEEGRAAFMEKRKPKFVGR